MALLELEGIAAGYVEGIDILGDITLRVEPGSITGVIGPNGAGKSTLLKAIFGFLHPRRGRIALEGRDIHALAPYEIKRLGISYVPQGANIFPQLTVEENLQLGAWVIRQDRARVAGRLDSAYTAFPRLREKRRSRATTLSGGEAKMLSLAKELVTEPRLLLVDEPSAGLAPRIVEQVYAQLLAVRERGVTILLVDQNINKAVQVSDYLYMIERGDVRREGPRRDFADQLRARHALPPHAGHLSRAGNLGVRGVGETAGRRGVPDHARRPGAQDGPALRHRSADSLLLSLPRPDPGFSPRDLADPAFACRV